LKSESELMNLCFEQALKGQYLVPPDPYVGCILEYQGNVLSEGYRHHYGGVPAEIDALKKVDDPVKRKKSTLFLNIEPICNGEERSPVTTLIQSEVKRVVIGVRIDGRSIAKLREAKIEVIEGVEERRARFLNRRFFTSLEKERPYIIVKWSETSDGFIARAKDDEPEWITAETGRALAHTLRAREMSILVGTNTALSDNPELVARPPNLTASAFRNPLRLVIDKKLSLPKTLNLFDGKVPTLVINSTEEGKRGLLEYVRIDFSLPVLDQILKRLAERNIVSLIVEGGAITHSSFIQSGLWDEAHIFRSPKKFGRGICSPALIGNPVNSAKRSVGDDQFFVYSNHDFGNYPGFPSEP
jgi:diaminohydroxyphosphoribosylaminopyrimidine deaminase/5-amino-6-(5-phosphoribosylamino)uracil reductase